MNFELSQDHKVLQSAVRDFAEVVDSCWVEHTGHAGTSGQTVSPGLYVSRCLSAVNNFTVPSGPKFCHGAGRSTGLPAIIN